MRPLAAAGLLEPRSETIVVAGARMRVLAAGTGAPLLYLHGVGDLGGWLPALGMLAETSAVLRPDHPGFNGSDDDAAITSVAGLAARHLDLLDALGVDRVDVVGTSLGGWVAAELALRAPERVRSLVLVDAAGLPTPPSTASMFELDPDELLARTCGDAASVAAGRQREAAVRADAQLLAARARNADAALRLAGGPRLADPGLAARLPGIVAPALVVWGSDDGLVPVELADQWSALLPDARRHVIDGAGHLPFVDRPEEFVGAVRDFLQPSGVSTGR
ncbi:MAG: alpha/beta fold hydrolase [Blastococcus sp.]